MNVITKIIDGICFITVENTCGMEVTLSSFGASFYDIKTMDKDGNLESIILTPKNLDDFYYTDAYYGKCVGRYSGRIDDSKCEINGIVYNLERNWNGINALHGGSYGISFKNFNFEIIQCDEYVDVTFNYFEKENDLPGDVEYKINYRIYDLKDEINLSFEAKSNKDTYINLTNHAYFNLSGNGKRDCLNQKLQLLCDRYTRLNNNLITESIDPVNEVMDFRELHEIGKYIYDSSLQNHVSKGYDHCFLKEDKNEELIAVMVDEESGRRLQVKTSYPSIVCYAGCYPKEFLFNGDFMIRQYHSMCLECQFVPNGINMENDKSILKQGEIFNHFITYEFDVLK